MDLAALTEMWVQLSGNGVQPTSIVIVLIISNILTGYFADRQAKGKNRVDMLNNAVQRQEQIDRQNAEIIENFRKEVNRVTRENAKERKEKEKYVVESRTLYEKNQELLTIINELTIAKERLQHHLDVLGVDSDDAEEEDD